MSELKILMLNHEFPPVGGGASPITFELSKQLVQMGHRVDVVTMHYGDLPRFETVDGVNIYRTPAIRKRPNICYAHELATYVPGALIKTVRLARKEKYDITHCHFIIPGGPLAWLVRKFAGTPFIITCHGSDVPGYNPDRFKSMHKVLLPSWRFLIRRTPLLASPSESLKKLILQSCQDARITVIPNGIYTERFGKGPKEKSILMCSRILPRKGFQYAIQAVKDMELDWQVNVVGEGPYLPELKKLAEGSKTPIKFWGWLDNNDPKFYELFSKSAIFIFPSEAENFPSALLEALASGMAIITSTAGGCPEVVGKAGILVEPGDTEGIRKMLTKLVDSDQLRQQLRKQALERARQFNWENIAQQYLNCYDQILNAPAGN
ncbi:MAG: glycosyltransferase family 4 protein [Planctomycetota bacterium]